MTTAALFRSPITTFAKRVVLFLTAIVSSLAAAQAVPGVQANTGNDDGTTAAKVPYRGTSVSYGHSLSAYNPTPETWAYTHRIGLMPEWHFNESFAVRGRLFIVQELTLSDTTNRPHEVELWDLWLDGVWSGWKEKVTGIKFGADVRFTLPTSKQSQAASRLFTFGPGVNVSRTFKVLEGLTLAYSFRGTWRFNRFATRQNQGGLITNCEVSNIEACSATSSGSPNTQADILHGPTVLFNPHEKVNISATFFMQRGWLAALPATELAAAVPVQTRDFMGFSFGVTWQPWDVVGLTLSSFTFANQLGSDGLLMFPLFNRNTTVSLDATFDLEAVVSSITKEKK
jgi:hypothetical protein